MPAAVSPWRHDAENFSDFRSRAGQFLHFPLFLMFIHNVDYPKLEQWITVTEREARAIPFVWCFHPYEICNKDKTRLDDAKIRMLGDDIRRLVEFYHLMPANLKALTGLFGGPL
jgi:hypothetical protein